MERIAPVAVGGASLLADCAIHLHFGAAEEPRQPAALSGPEQRCLPWEGCRNPGK